MRLWARLGVAGLMVVAVSSAAGSLAQEATAQHPADIRAGSCASLGEVVVPLTTLMVPEGDSLGQAGATPVKQSVTEVPLLLPDILSANHAVAVHASPDLIGTPVACGDIGGTLGADGTLSIGLQAMNGARMGGVASLAPAAAGDATLVTILLFDERRDRERGADSGDAGETPEGATDGTVAPAPDHDKSADATDTGDSASAGNGQPNQAGEDGAVDHPGRDSDGGRDDDQATDGNGADGKDGGDRGRESKSGEGKGARAGEDGAGSS
jgi:hypothetical protein